MTSTLKQYREQMFTLVDEPDGFGRVESIATLAAQSMTVAALAVGTLASTKYQNKWLCRPDATTTADRVRMCSAYTSSSGTLTHAGTAYADTTVNSEVVEISEYEPARADTSINRALGRLRRRDVEIIPTNGGSRYWLGQLNWINEPGDVDMVRYAPNPVLSRNRDFAKWNIATPDTATSTAVPDNFTLTGTSATSVRITTNVAQTGQYGVQVVAGAGSVSQMYQSIGLLSDGVSSDNLVSKAVTVVVVGRATAASKLRGWYSDDGGTTKQYTSYHTGNSLQQELTFQATVGSSASNPTFGWEQAASATCQVSSCYLVLNAISDGVRKQTYQAAEIEKMWDQSAGPGALVLKVPQQWSLGGQIEVHSKRAYPTLTLDTDTADAPIVTIATGALFLMFRGMATKGGEDDTRYKQLAAYWQDRYATVAGKHYYTEFGQYGAPWPPRLLTPFPVRIG